VEGEAARHARLLEAQRTGAPASPVHPTT
jgi:hypothetical protein